MRDQNGIKSDRFGIKTERFGKLLPRSILQRDRLGQLFCKCKWGARRPASQPASPPNGEPTWRRLVERPRGTPGAQPTWCPPATHLAESPPDGHPAESPPGGHLTQSPPGPPGGESTWWWKQNMLMIFERPTDIVHASWLLGGRENRKRQVAGLPSGHSGICHLAAWSWPPD